MNDVIMFFACVGVIALYLVGVVLISGIFANIITDGTADDYDYAMSAVVLLMSYLREREKKCQTGVKEV